MRSDRVIGVIPARLGSERLPRKPLQPLLGRPLIEWVWRRASGFEVLDEVVVATDSEEIAAACRSIGARAVLTSTEHASGTERVAEVLRATEFRDYGYVVNVQGDEPFIAEEHVAAAVGLVRGGWDVGTVAAPVGTLEAWRDPAVVKVVRRSDGGALYFSRAAIPYRREGEPGPRELASPRYLRHVGVYAYQANALARWITLPAHPLEEIERLEQLRALAGGLRIGVELVDGAEGGVDTPEDLRRVEENLRQRQEAGVE